MKKLIWIVPAILLFVLLVLFFLLPTQPVVHKKVALNANQNSVAKLLAEKGKWQQWWPDGEDRFVYDSLNFSFQLEMLKSAVLHVPFGDSLLPAQLNTISYDRNSSAAIFQVSLPEASGPVEKISNYFKSRQIASSADDLLERLKAFAEKEENIYGFAVKEEKVKDSAFVAYRFQTTGYPATEQIYSAVALLQRYADSAGATVTGAPMLHADHQGKEQYQVMVALPVNKPLEGNGTVVPKRMVQGKILVTEIKGGAASVEQALQRFEEYVTDHRRTSPAIPYQSLLTDRRQQPDSSKWITRLYYPVF